MATDTANVIAGVRRTGEVCMLVAVGVTAEATLVRLRHAQVFKDDDLAFVASAFHVGLPRTVAGLAIHAFTRSAGLKSHLVVGRSFRHLVDVFVASLAGFRTHVPGVFGLARRSGRRRALLHISRLHMPHGYEKEGDKQEKQLADSEMHASLHRTWNSDCERSPGTYDQFGGASPNKKPAPPCYPPPFGTNNYDRGLGLAATPIPELDLPPAKCTAHPSP